MWIHTCSVYSQWTCNCLKAEEVPYNSYGKESNAQGETILQEE